MFPLDQNLNSFVPLYTAPASKNFRRGRRDCEKRGSVESRSLVSYLRNCENIDTDCLSIKSDPIGNFFICSTDEQSFFHDRQLLSGNCSESDKANWPSDNQMDVFLKFFQCVHRKLLSRRVRTEEQIRRRDPQIQNKDIIMFCAPFLFSHGTKMSFQIQCEQNERLQPPRTLSACIQHILF